MRKPLFLFLMVFVLLFVASSLHADPAPVLPDPHGPEFRGEICLHCHSGMPVAKPQTPGEKADVVIVGGGMAGLAALHYLHDVDAVLLETQERVGGQMLMSTWNGIPYAEGAAYLPDTSGIVRDFVDETKIPFISNKTPHNSAWIDGKYYADCWVEGRDKMPWKGKDRENWLAFLKEVDEISSSNSSFQPFENFSTEQKALDLITAHEWMQKKGLNPQMIQLFDLYIASCFGETGARVSAAAFANFIAGEVGHCFTMPGGMGAVTQYLYGKMKKRIRTNCHVLRIEQDRDEARVTYLDPQNKQKTIRARAVISAVPCKVLPTIIPDLPQEKRDVISKTKHAGYLVATVLCKEPFWDDKGYDTWCIGTFFSDIIDATWVSRDGHPQADRKAQHVLSLYIPRGEPGTAELLTMDPANLKKLIIADLEKVVPGCSSKIIDMRFQRFGHSMHVAEPGFMTNSVPVLRKPWYRIAFAGAETEGMPCTESSVVSAFRAARDARTWLWPDLPTPTVSLLDRLRQLKQSGKTPKADTVGTESSAH
ncbi:MAG: FAD-dependent oxidoreductase [Candidatus Riflebacteria bacterium]|nr:FAD-dependent oxidoreductase [Candidatus Riflebacteria bacterium]